jgi:hypothetical protein
VGDAGLSSWLAAGASVLSAAATIFLVVFIWSQICANKWTWRGKERRGSDARWCARTRGEPTGADPALDSQPHYDLRHRRKLMPELGAVAGGRNRRVQGIREMEPGGIEPPTSCLQSRRSPS